MFNACVKRLPGVLAKKFDSTVFGPASGAPGANFDTLENVTAVSIATDTYDALVTADSVVADGDGILTGWAISPQARKILLLEKDNDGRPLFINNPQTDGSVPALLGSPVHQVKSVYLAVPQPKSGLPVTDRMPYARRRERPLMSVPLCLCVSPVCPYVCVFSLYAVRRILLPARSILTWLTSLRIELNKESRLLGHNKNADQANAIFIS